MRRFDYLFLENELLPANLITLTGTIYALQTGAEMRKTDYLNIFTQLEKVAKIQSIKSSNALEGIITSDERLAAIVNRGSAPLNHNEAEIAGYRDALDMIHQNFSQIEFSESTILDLHEMMMAYSGDAQAGRYKTHNNVIIEHDLSGQRKIRFTPLSSDETSAAMQQLILAHLDASDHSSINQLLLIPCVILDFVCIHPFRDGNGRMSRLLSLLLLYRAGFDVGRYISFEEQISVTKNHYYEALQQSSVHWLSNENSYRPFIQNFLVTLYLCYKELDKRFSVVNSTKTTKMARIEATVLNHLTPISKAEICTILPDVSPTTVEKVLGQLVKDGKVTIVGAGRTTKYIRR